MKNMAKLVVILATAGCLAGCGGFFDDLAAYQGPVTQGAPAPDTDYVAACHTYGCPSTPAQPVRPATGCAYPLPDGTYPTGGTACPQ